MKIRDRIIEALQDGIKSNKELHFLIPDKNTRIISATISNNLSVFIRLDQALIGLKSRDKDKVTGNRINAGKFCLYKKMVNILQNGEKKLSEIYAILPNEKKVSIISTVNMRPDLFIRIAIGMIGRTGRDEYLIEKYKITKESTKIVKVKIKQISEYIEEVLYYGEMSLEEIYLRIPFPRTSITSRLSKNPRFERIKKSIWKLNVPSSPSFDYE